MLRTLRPQFVMTLSTLGIASVGAGCKTPPAEVPPVPSITPVAESSPSTPSAGPAPSIHPTHKPIDYTAYPQQLNARDSKQGIIYRTPTGCVVQVADDSQPTSWRPPKTATIACPASMQHPAWNLCTYGTLSANADRSECVCSKDGNPPPPPTLTDCPR